MTISTASLRTLAAAAVLLLSTVAAGAAELCLPREAAVAQLEQGYDERRTNLGLVEGGQVVLETFVSASGTWTVMLTDTNGVSCVIATGSNWTRRPVLVGDRS